MADEAQDKKENNAILSRRGFLKFLGATGVTVGLGSLANIAAIEIGKNKPKNPDLVAIEELSRKFFDETNDPDKIHENFLKLMEGISEKTHLYPSTPMYLVARWTNKNFVFSIIEGKLQMTETDTQTKKTTSVDKPLDLIKGLDPTKLSSIEISISNEPNKTPLGAFNGFENDQPKIYKEYKRYEGLCWYSKWKGYVFSRDVNDNSGFEKYEFEVISLFEVKSKTGFMHMFRNFGRTKKFNPTANNNYIVDYTEIEGNNREQFFETMNKRLP